VVGHARGKTKRNGDGNGGRAKEADGTKFAEGRGEE
jgi:hypothetical protein